MSNQTQLVKAEKVALPNIKTAFLSIPHFLAKSNVPEKLKAITKGIDLKTYSGSDSNKSYKEHMHERCNLIKSADCIIIAINSERNVSHGTTKEFMLAQSRKKPIYLFDISTGKIEKYKGHLFSAHFLPISDSSRMRKVLVPENRDGSE